MLMSFRSVMLRPRGCAGFGGSAAPAATPGADGSGVPASGALRADPERFDGVAIRMYQRVVEASGAGAAAPARALTNSINRRLPSRRLSIEVAYEIRRKPGASNASPGVTATR